MKSNKKLIVIISIVLTLVVASVSLVYLFFMTDIFKSKEELFAKYFSQDIEALGKIIDLKSIDIYDNLRNETTYESSTNIKTTYSEGGEISNPLNNLSLKLDVQKNSNEQYLYANGKILFENETYLEAEVIKEEQLYGFRIPEAVKQFASVKNDENLENVANDIGIDIDNLSDIMGIFDGSIDEIQSEALKDKYLNIIKNGISMRTFEKQKKVVIDVEKSDIQTNAYSVLLSSEQVENLLTEILNNIKDETTIMEKIPIKTFVEDAINWIDENSEIPTIKITVYEKNKQTIRTSVEVGKHKFTIENIEQETKSKIKYFNNDVEKLDVDIIKNKTNEKENFDVIANIIDVEKNYTVLLSSQIELIENQIRFDTEISLKQDIITVSLILENQVDIGVNFERKQSLKEAGNVTLNNLEEQRRKDVIELIKLAIPQTINERMTLLGTKFGIENETDIPAENIEAEKIPQIEINKFNSKFEFYTGDEVSAENVRMLLDIAKNNITGHAITDVNINTETEDESNAKKIISLYIEKDKTNEDSITKVLEEIDNSNKYKVSIFYKEENGLIDYITITEI